MVSNAGFSFPVMETSSENDSLEQPRLGTDWQGSSDVEEAWGYRRTASCARASGESGSRAGWQRPGLNKQEHRQEIKEVIILHLSGG